MVSSPNGSANCVRSWSIFWFKSSLLNALLGHDRVIVTPVPGTTRDVIEESINLEGLRVVLWDTAGIRSSDDPVEKIGVDRSLAHLERADAALVVLDGSV